MRNVAVAGVGQTKFGELWDRSLKSIMAESILAAINDSKIGADDVQALYVGNMAAGRFSGQEHLGALAADYAGLAPIPAIRCEGACASGALAFSSAYLAVASGKYDVAVACGAEKMTDLSPAETTTALMGAGEQEWESSAGLTFAGLYALIARAHMSKFGTTSEQLAMVAVTNHENSVGNKYAQFPFKITLEAALNSTMVADPLRLFDCSPITDGSASVVLVSENLAKKLNSPVWILASEIGTDTVALHDRASLVEMNSVKSAVKKAYGNSGLTPEKIDVMEVHDCFSINEVIGIEDLGFCKKGKGGKFVADGEIKVGGSAPTNTMGGLKANGHPVGATGIRQIMDVTRQLRRESYNQVKGAKTGLALNVGGSGATAAIHILGMEVK